MQRIKHKTESSTLTAIAPINQAAGLYLNRYPKGKHSTHFEAPLHMLPSERTHRDYIAATYLKAIATDMHSLFEQQHAERPFARTPTVKYTLGRTEEKMIHPSGSQQSPRAREIRAIATQRQTATRLMLSAHASMVLTPPRTYHEHSYFIYNRCNRQQHEQQPTAEMPYAHAPKRHYCTMDTSGQQDPKYAPGNRHSQTTRSNLVRSVIMPQTAS